jgi:1-acyl-sn-glycerol-3-phosphate acyltransferase
VIVARSLLFNVAFYIVLVICLLLAMPTLALPRWGILGFARFWARINLFLLRVICGTKVEWRGLERLPKGALLVAAKHQSIWETFALLLLFSDPAFILKRELTWIPIFGWYLWRGEMVPIDRGGGKSSLVKMTAAADAALKCGRQLVIFPEGTRRPIGAQPAYKVGIAHLYAEGVAPCLPIALNSGLFWPRRKFLRRPGTIIVEILEPIAPGLSRDVFFTRLQTTIEQATARLVDEAGGPMQPP